MVKIGINNIIRFEVITINLLTNILYCILDPIETFTDKDSEFYDLSRGQRLAVIFNHETYKYDRAQERTGTRQDCQAISKSFEKLGFKVKQYDDLEV